MVFWVLGAEGTKDSTKGTCRTCWTRLEILSGRRVKGSWLKKGILAYTILLGLRGVASISFMKLRMTQEHI